MGNAQAEYISNEESLQRMEILKYLIGNGSIFSQIALFKGYFAIFPYFHSYFATCADH